MQPKTEQKTGPLGTFDPRLFRQAIQGLGLSFRWSRAVECPCRLENSDQFDPSCAKCGGDGWWYVNPETNRDRHNNRNYVDVKCTFGQASLTPSLFEEFGGFTFSEALMTMQQEMRVGYRDRFISTEQVMSWTELLISPGQGATIAIGKSGRSTTAQQQSMRYEPISINFIADSDDNRFYPSVDYRILEGTESEPARLQFLSGRGPAAEKMYTIHYDCRPVWIVDDATYGVQGLRGPDAGLKGIREPQVLPTTFKVRLDFLTGARGT